MQPTSAVVGAVFAQALSVAVQDSPGGTDTTASDTITVALGMNPTGGTLAGITTVIAVKGVATFSTLSIGAPGTGYTIIASASGLTAATSAPIAVTPGSVPSLAFVVQPSLGTQGQPLNPAVQVAIRDTGGNVMTAATNPVMIAIGTNPNNATLSGTTTVAAVKGIATFSTLRLSRAGIGYTLNAYSAGLRGATSATFRITIPPVVHGTVTPATGATRSGDTVRFVLSATDTTDKVAWLGYRLSAPAAVSDSVAGGGPTLNHTFSVVATNGWVGIDTVMVFARDSSGDVTQAGIGFVYVAINRPTRTVPLAGPVRDMVFDSVRSVLYLSQPDSEVAVLSTATLEFQTPIRLSGTPAGLDLSVGGDSLVVALQQGGNLAIVNLATHATDTVHLNFDTLYGTRPNNLRVMGNDKALVSLTFAGSGYGGKLLEYDLVAGTQRKRTDAGLDGDILDGAPLARAIDRSRLLLQTDNGEVYTTAADSFTLKIGTVPRYDPSISADATGAHFLIGGSLFDGSLTRIATFPSYGGGPNVISPDASVAYMGTSVGFLNGYLKVHVPDGAVLEQVVLPGIPSLLYVLPNGQTLVVDTVNPSTGAHRLALVALQ